jgi:hypothetical protein
MNHEIQRLEALIKKLEKLNFKWYCPERNKKIVNLKVDLEKLKTQENQIN